MSGEQESRVEEELESDQESEMDESGSHPQKSWTEKDGGEIIIDLYHSSELHQQAMGTILKGFFEMSIFSVLPFLPLTIVGLVHSDFHFALTLDGHSVTVIGAGVTASLLAAGWCYLEKAVEKSRRLI